MPAEDPNQAEELLKRYAKARREQGGDFPLHPATRRLLQGEVARTYPAGSREPRRGLWLWLGGWPKLALGATAIAAVTLLAIWMGNPGRENEFKLGDNLAQTPQPRPSAEERAEVEQLALLKLGRDSQPAFEEKQIKEAFDKKLSDREQPTRVEPLYAGAELGTLKDGATAAAERTPPPPAAQGPAPTTLEIAANEPRPDAKLRAMAPAAPAVPAPGKAEASMRASAPGAAAQAGVSPTVLAESRHAVLPIDALRQQSQSGATNGAKSVAAKGSGAAANAPTLNYFADTPMLGTVLEPTKPVEGDQASADHYNFGTIPSPTGTVFLRENRLGESTVKRQAMRRSEDLKKTDEAPASADILDRFTFEQRGSMVRMLESDGSVYEGTIITVANGDGGVAGLPVQEVERNRSRATRPNERQPAGNLARFYSFQAIGTNVTLGKAVVVQGRLREDTAGPETFRSELEIRREEALVTDARSRAQRRPQPASRSAISGPQTSARQSAVLTNWFRSIEGTLRVGGTKEQPFKAITIPR
jgi:hypothetical protein